MTRQAPPSSEAQLLKIALLIVVVSSLYATAHFPLIQDESYYLSWALRTSWPDLGFFDHPPFVSWQAGIFRFINDSSAARIMVWICAVLTCLFQVKLVNLYVKLPEKLRLLPAVLGFGSLGALANSILLTPDSGLLLFWTLSLYLAAKALNERKALTPSSMKIMLYWMACGVASGLAFYAKYTAILLAPVLFIGILLEEPKALKTRHPYVGLLFCFLVMSPQIVWNAHHDWVTLRFQFGHGFSQDHGVVHQSQLPTAIESTPLSPVQLLQKEFLAKTSPDPTKLDQETEVRKEKSRMDKIMGRIGDFLGGALGLWGLFILPLSLAAAHSYRQKSCLSKNQKLLSAFGLPLTSTVFVLIFFGILSPFSKIEANWTAIHIPGAVVLICASLAQTRLYLSGICASAILHSLVLLLLCNYKTFEKFIPNLSHQRIFQEQAGYEEIVSTLKNMIPVNEPLVVDTYQLKASLLVRNLNRNIIQWPGITRPSEFTRGHPDDLVLEGQLLNASRFTLMTSEKHPKDLPGWTATSLQRLRTCSPSGVQILTNYDTKTFSCPKKIREWWIIDYTINTKLR